MEVQCKRLVRSTARRMLAMVPVMLALGMTPAFAATYYVSTGGSDSNAGTQSAPFQTITKAAGVVNPGDTVIVTSGTYTGSFTLGRGGNSSSVVTFLSQTPGGAKIVGTGYSALNVTANYITIDGFDIDAADGHGVDVESVHHVTVQNCIVHDCGGGGIETNGCDYISVLHNRTYNNAATNGYQCSGISLYQQRPISDAGSGFHNIIAGNISYNNIEGSAITADHTDGNGIIIDDFHNGQSGGTGVNYPYQTLVENNICYGNGGKGIQVYVSDHVTVRNNTCYGNNRDNRNSGTWRGEINIQNAADCVFANNIAVANPGYNANNSAILAGVVNFDDSTTTVFNNLTFNGTVGQASVSAQNGSRVVISPSNNVLGVDPLLKSPTATPPDFHLTAGSPAIHAGTNGGSSSAAATDFDGVARPNGSPVDIGAYQYTGGSGPQVRYGFESGTQGWTSGGVGISSIASSTAKYDTGTHSLAIKFSGSNSGLGYVSAANPTAPAGSTITFRIWIPSNSTFNWIQPYVQTGDWTWVSSTISNPPKATWFTVTVQVPSNAAVPLNTIGVQFNRTSGFTGTVYLDSISW